MIVEPLIAMLRAYGIDPEGEIEALVCTAEKFVMNPGEFTEEQLDGAEAFARDLLKNGIFPIPHDRVLFRFGPDGMTTYGGQMMQWVLVWRECDDAHSRLLFRCFLGLSDDELRPHSLIGEIVYNSPNSDGWWGHWRAQAVDALTRELIGRARLNAIAKPAEAGRLMRELSARIGAPEDEAKKIISEFAWSDDRDIDLVVMDGGLNRLLCAMGLMNTGGVDRAFFKAPKFINGIRARKKKPPIYSHYTLRIPGMSSKGHSSVGSFVGVRLHFRRGHVRTLPSGRKVMVRPCLVGDLALGYVSKEYEIGSIVPALS